MTAKQFEYGLMATAIYRGLLWCILITPMLGPDIFVGYVLLMLFLGLGLRPLLEKTSLYRVAIHLQIVTLEKTSQGFMDKRKAKIVSRQRDESYRKRRGKHPDLPKDW
jgi:hypothetical protein|tara:strand:- start:828 stop:1151 length:324 start_codon:yes stop_codon:yes gene_type:complete